MISKTCNCCLLGPGTAAEAAANPHLPDAEVQVRPRAGLRCGQLGQEGSNHDVLRSHCRYGLTRQQQLISRLRSSPPPEQAMERAAAL